MGSGPPGEIKRAKQGPVLFPTIADAHGSFLESRGQMEVLEVEWKSNGSGVEVGGSGWK